MPYSRWAWRAVAFNHGRSFTQLGTLSNQHPSLPLAPFSNLAAQALRSHVYSNISLGAISHAPIPILTTPRTPSRLLMCSPRFPHAHEMTMNNLGAPIECFG